jgi:hypothetical protein
MTNDDQSDLRGESGGQHARRPLRFSLQSLLWLTIVAALVLTCLLQSQKLRNAQIALARNAWASREVAVPSGNFRLLVNKIIDDRDTKFYVIRFEANEEHYVSADGAMSITTAADDGRTHWAEIQILASYDSTLRRMTALRRVASGSGSAGGQAIYTLPPNAKPDEFVNITVKPGVYDLTQPVELGSIGGKPVNITVK